MFKSEVQLKITSKYLIGLLFLVFLVSLLCIMQAPKADALTLNPEPGTSWPFGIPPGERFTIMGCDAGVQSPGFVRWVSETGNRPGPPSVNVAYGTQTVALTYHELGAVCLPNSAVTETRYQIAGISTTQGFAQGGVGGVGQLFYSPYNSVGIWWEAGVDFVYNNGTPLTSTTTVGITVDSRIINRFTNGVYGCVAAPANAAVWNYGACAPAYFTFFITINVGPAPIPGCTDPAAINYNPAATVNDGSCYYDICANIPGNQATVPPGYFQSGPNCYQNDSAPSLALLPQCAQSRVRVQSNDANGDAYNIEFSTNGGATYTAVGRSADGFFYINLGSSGDFASVTVLVRTDGIRPPYVWSPLSNSASTTYGPCINANCSVSAPAGPWYVGEPYVVSFTVTNNGGRNWGAAEGYTLRALAGSTNTIALASNIAIGGTWSPTTTITTPGIPQAARTYTWQMSRGGTDFGTVCTFTRDILYRPPVGGVDATCAINPPGFIQVGSVNNPLSVSVQYTNPSTGGTAAPTGNVTAANARVNAVNATRTTPLPYGLSRGVPGSIDYTFNAPPAGTFVLDATATFTIPNGIGGNYIVGPVTCTGSSSVNVGNQPYLKVFTGDVQAGAQFSAIDPTCTVAANTGGIAGFAGGSGTGSAGASGQFSLSSLLSIGSFYSASQRDTALATTLPALGLSIGNTSGGYGGGSAMPRCLPNYFNDTRDPAVPQSNTAPPASVGAGAGRIRYVVPVGDLTMNGFSVGLGSQVAIYVDGNVYINGDISLDNNRAALTDSSSLPYLAIIASGNIYIDNNVQRVDGLYVAQPRDALTGGKIYTCSEALNDHYVLTELWANCQTPLRVNGSLVAKHVRYGRANGTQSSATPREYPPSLTAFNNFNNVAETIVYSPELWLAPSPLSNPNSGSGNGSVGDYDSASSLPPVF
jgi:hypothetical protein